MHVMGDDRRNGVARENPLIRGSFFLQSFVGLCYNNTNSMKRWYKDESVI